MTYEVLSAKIQSFTAARTVKLKGKNGKEATLGKGVAFRVKPSVSQKGQFNIQWRDGGLVSVRVTKEQKDLFVGKATAVNGPVKKQVKAATETVLIEDLVREELDDNSKFAKMLDMQKLEVFRGSAFIPFISAEQIGYLDPRLVTLMKSIKEYNEMELMLGVHPTKNKFGVFFYLKD